MGLEALTRTAAMSMPMGTVDWRRRRSARWRRTTTMTTTATATATPAAMPPMAALEMTPLLEEEFWLPASPEPEPAAMDDWSTEMESAEMPKSLPAMKDDSSEEGDAVFSVSVRADTEGRFELGDPAGVSGQTDGKPKMSLFKALTIQIASDDADSNRDARIA